MVKLNDYAGGQTAWCPGCGNFGILTAVKKALTELNLEPYQVLMVSGIGQAGKLPHYTRGNVLNVLHGRALPAAVGAKLANAELTVLAIGGDGDGYGEGGNHFIHSMRRNHDLTYLVHNNQVYALTKGQASPTSDQGFISKTTPGGAGAPLNPLLHAIACDVGLVARSFAGDNEHLSQMIKLGIRHKGFALIDVLQPCVSFNHVNTFAWYRQRVYKLGNGYDPTDKTAAFQKAQEWGDKIPIGVIYQNNRPAFEDAIPSLKKGPLVNQKLNPAACNKLLDEFI
jgi:2-oxoglutarate/2-oxoacid ferredoxin oxidoreductase subunit beta